MPLSDLAIAGERVNLGLNGILRGAGADLLNLVFHVRLSIRLCFSCQVDKAEIEKNIAGDRVCSLSIWSEFQLSA